MKFQKYPSITNSYQETFLNRIRLDAYSTKQDWYVTEKIHGANFSYWSDGEEVKVASRSQFVDANFMGANKAIERYMESAKKVANDIIKHYNVIEYVVIFGELFGGNIQKGINYGDKDFIVFDIAVKRADKEKLVFLNFENLQYYIRNSYLNMLEPLFVGSLDECLEYPNEFNSKILGIENNLCEGVVIRPVQNSTLYNGDRIILKNKNQKWSERVRTKINNKPKKFTHDLQPQIEEYINENRFDNVMSKLGGIESLTNKDFGKVIGLFANDVIEDLVADGILPEYWKKDDTLKPLGGWISEESKELLIELFLKKV